MLNIAMSSARLLSGRIESAIKSGNASLMICQEKGVEVSLVVFMDRHSDVKEAIQSLESVGLKDQFILDEKGQHMILNWKAVTPSSIHHFSSAFGDQLTYLGLTAMHENPDSIHALNTAYCMGKKKMFDDLAERRMDYDPSSPGMG